MTSDLPIIALDNILIGFGGQHLFQNVELNLLPGTRTCLVGKNGTGKSTLLKLIAGLIEADQGNIYIQPGLKISFLQQNTSIKKSGTVADFMLGSNNKNGQPHEVEEILSKVKIDGGRNIRSLSGGESRRVDLAKALLGSPELILLDEPTNHLDIDTIKWLEDRLIKSNKTFLVISHDRAFLKAVSTETLWLHQQTILHHKAGYDEFDKWSERLVDEEKKRAQRLATKLQAEKHWLIHGVTARRKRNQGRIKKLKDLRDQHKKRLEEKSNYKAKIDSGKMSGRLVIEASGLSKQYNEKKIISNFSTKIMKGDRVGVLGSNGSGKTTLLNLLIGNTQPDSGTSRLGSNLNIAIFDQLRETLELSETPLQALVPGGGDSLVIRGKQRNVISYLNDFLFDPKQIHTKISTLSGGEQNRLLLAKILSRESNLLILDEPTNDLDLDTLDLLQEMLDDYNGTIIIVSHDRDFLDSVVTSTLVIESEGKVTEYAGGYTDYTHQIAKRITPKTATKKKANNKRSENNKKRSTAKVQKLSYKDQRELDELPKVISFLEKTKKDIESKLSDPQLFSRDPNSYKKLAKELKDTNDSISSAENRWLELEAESESLKN